MLKSIRQAIRAVKCCCTELSQSSNSINCSFLRKSKMAKYVVHFEMRKGNNTTSSSKTVECETESTAIQIAEGQGRKDRPGYDFILKKVEKK